MSFVVSLALCSVLLPQNPPATQGDAGQKPLLSAAEQASLRDKLSKYLADEAAYFRGGKDRDKNAQRLEKSKETWTDEWKKLEAKVQKNGVLLGSMADLRPIFENCFQMKTPKNSPGELRRETVKDPAADFAYILPKSYKHTTPTRVLFVLPGSASADAPGQWAKPQDYFAATWDKSPTAADTTFHFPVVPAGLELDPVPDFSREGADAEEQRRIEAMWVGLGELMQNTNIDRSRVVLDCGRAASGFGLRLMTMFPDRWAGAILRAPSAVDDIRLGSMSGIPVVLLRTGATAAVVDALKKRLEEVSPGLITVIDAADEYPHKAATPEIEKWLAGRKRSMVPKKVVIEPNHDRFNRAYWVDIDVADSLQTAAADKKPRLEVIAERDVNRITVKAVGVEKFTLVLNDDLVNLDKEFTVVINDKAVTEKRTRSLRDLREQVATRMDWDYLFPAKFTSTVPK